MRIRTVHSSVDGTNFDILLEVKDKIVLTNLGILQRGGQVRASGQDWFFFWPKEVVGGNFNGFSSYLKDAYVFEFLIVTAYVFTYRLVWFSETKPNPKLYSSKFDNFTREQFNALPPDAPNRPNLVWMYYYPLYIYLLVAYMYS